jgi:rare lipoprotein A
MLSGKHASGHRVRPYLPVIAAVVVAGILIGAALLALRFESSGLNADRKAADLAPASPLAIGASATESASPSATPSEAAPAVPSPEARPSERADRGTARSPAAATSPAVPKSTLPLDAGGATVTSSGTCGASFYDTGQLTATGENFDPEGITAAHKTLPFNTRVRVTNTANGKQVVVRINDRGPFVAGRCIDLSRGAFRQIASLSAGVLTVKFEVLA